MSKWVLATPYVLSACWNCFHVLKKHLPVWFLQVLQEDTTFWSEKSYWWIHKIIYLPRRMFDFRFRATAKIRLTLHLLFPILIVGQNLFSWLTPQICQRARRLPYQRFRRSGTYEHLCRSSKRWFHWRSHRRVGKRSRCEPHRFRDRCKADISDDTQDWWTDQVWSQRLRVWLYLVVLSFL